MCAWAHVLMRYTQSINHSFVYKVKEGRLLIPQSLQMYKGVHINICFMHPLVVMGIGNIFKIDDRYINIDR